MSPDGVVLLDGVVRGEGCNLGSLPCWEHTAAKMGCERRPRIKWFLHGNCPKGPRHPLPAPRARVALGEHPTSFSKSVV